MIFRITFTVFVLLFTFLTSSVCSEFPAESPIPKIRIHFEQHHELVGRNLAQGGIILSKPLSVKFFKKSFEAEDMDKYFHVDSTINIEFSGKPPVSLPCLYVVVDGTIRDDQLVITGGEEKYAGFIEKLTIAPIEEWKEMGVKYTNLFTKSLQYHKKYIFEQFDFNDALDQFLSNPVYIPQLEKFYLISIYEQVEIFISEQSQYETEEIENLKLALMVKFYPYIPDRLDCQIILNELFELDKKVNDKSSGVLKTILLFIDDLKLYFPNLSLDDHLTLIKMMASLKIQKHLSELIKSFGSKFIEGDLPRMQFSILNLLDWFTTNFSMNRNDQRPSLFEGSLDQLFRAIQEHWKFLPALNFEILHQDSHLTLLPIAPSLVFEVLALLECQDNAEAVKKIESIVGLLGKDRQKGLVSMDYAVCLKGKSSPLLVPLIQGCLPVALEPVAIGNFLAQNHLVRLFDTLLKNPSYFENVSDPKVFEPLLHSIVNFPESVLILLANSSLSDVDLEQIRSRMSAGNGMPSLVLVSYHLLNLQQPNLIVWRADHLNMKLRIIIPNWINDESCSTELHKYIVQYILLKYCQIPYDFSLKFMKDIGSITLAKYGNLMNQVFQKYFTSVPPSDPYSRKFKNTRIQVRPTTELDLVDLRSSPDPWLADYKFNTATQLNELMGLGVVFSKELEYSSGLSKIGLQTGKIYYLNRPIQLCFTLSVSKEEKMIWINRIAVDPDLPGKVLLYSEWEEQRFYNLQNSSNVLVKADVIEIMAIYEYYSTKTRVLDFLLTQIDAFPKYNPVEVFLYAVTKLEAFYSLSRDELKDILEALQQKIEKMNNDALKIWAKALVYYLFAPESVGAVDDCIDVKLTLFTVLERMSGQISANLDFRHVFKHIIKRLNITDCFVKNIGHSGQLAFLTDIFHLLSSLSKQTDRNERHPIWGILNDLMESFVESLAYHISLRCDNPDKESTFEGALDALKAKKQSHQSNPAYAEGYKLGERGPDPSLYPLIKNFLNAAGDLLTTSKVTQRWGYFSGGLFIFLRILKNSWKFIFTEAMIEAFWEPQIDEYGVSPRVPRKAICLGNFLGLLLSSNVSFLEAKMKQLPQSLSKVSHDYLNVLMQIEQFIQVSGMYLSGVKSKAFKVKEEGLKQILRLWAENLDPLEASLSLVSTKLPRLLYLYIGLDTFQHDWNQLCKAGKPRFWLNLISENLECFMVALQVLRPDQEILNYVIREIGKNHKCTAYQECTTDKDCPMKLQEKNALVIIQCYWRCIFQRASTVRTISKTRLSLTIPAWLHQSHVNLNHQYYLQAFLLFILCIPIDATFLAIDWYEPALSVDFPQLCSFILKRFRACNPEFCKISSVDSVQVEFEDSTEVYTDEKQLIFVAPTFHK